MKIRYVLAAAAASLVLGTTTAAYAAGPPYTVAVGASTTYNPSHPITATSTGPVSISILNNSATAISVSCTSLQFTGTATSGSGINPVLRLTSSTWTGCVIPGGAAHVAQQSTWNFVGTGSNATPGQETVGGYVSDVWASDELAALPAVCSFDLLGHMDASFDELTQQLVVDETGYTGNLTIALQPGSPCLGVLQTGNAMDFQAVLDVTSTDGDINLS